MRGVSLAVARRVRAWRPRSHLPLHLNKSQRQRERAVIRADARSARDDTTLTAFAFTRLLEWLDDGVSYEGQRYLEMRRRLVLYFDRRNRSTAEELADETLNRVGRTLAQDGEIATRPPARYCYVIARFVLLEDIRRERRYVQLDERRGPRSHRGAGGSQPSTLTTDSRCAKGASTASIAVSRR